MEDCVCQHRPVEVKGRREGGGRAEESQRQSTDVSWSGGSEEATRNEVMGLTTLCCCRPETRHMLSKHPTLTSTTKLHYPLH